MELEEIGHRIIGAAIEVHRELGPGLLESTYERCLMHELMLHGIKAERQKKQPINYKGLQIDDGYRIDILVDGKIILELKVRRLVIRGTNYGIFYTVEDRGVIVLRVADLRQNLEWIRREVTGD